MLFNSFEFLLFFPIVTVLYFLLPYKYRWSMLLAASCFFYMYFKAIYILILFFTIIIDYYAGILIEKAPNDKKKLYLVLSIISNVGVLAIFKYYNFINDNISGLCNLFGNTNPIPSLSILLPIGLSFHTFQAMSYTIEVYRGKQVAEKNFILYSLYVMFYPQLVAGPIERPQNILNQFKKENAHLYHRIKLDDYLLKFPEDIKHHPNYIKKTELTKFLSKSKNYVICKICGEKMKSISNTHLKNKHNITTLEYKLKYPNEKIVSTSISESLSDLAKLTNINMTPTWTSKGEIEIKEFIESIGFMVNKGKNRKLLDGKEIDLIIDGTNICIEYNGLYYHTEKMGKTSSYHLNKTMECNQIGYKLIHIFEDEWVVNTELVKSKLKHLLNVNDGVKIGGRNVVIKKINLEDKTFFLNNNHIQGTDKSNIYYGAYYNNELVGVITFNSRRNMTKNNDGEFELSRYSTKQNYLIRGLASKFIKHFINEYHPSSIISFADRRWTLDVNNNLYTKLGFELTKIFRSSDCICRISQLGFWVLVTEVNSDISKKLLKRVAEVLPDYFDIEISHRTKGQSQLDWYSQIDELHFRSN